MRARIRGIYATALTKLALDGGFEVVQPTKAMVERFGLRIDNGPPDVTVKDLSSKAGVLLLGKCEAVSAFASALRAAVDPFAAEAAQGVHEIFAGRVVEGGLVRTPDGGLAEVPGRYVVYPGSVRPFTVVKPALGPRRALATPELVVDGDYLELTTAGGVRFSRHIGEGERLRLRLLAEGRILRAMPGLGVRFKSSARFAGDDEIVEEAKRLYAELLEISARSWGEGEVMRRGRCLAVAVFDRASREALDSLRASVVPTARGHHFLRMQGLGECVDLLDGLGLDVHDRASLLLARGSVEIYHVKPWGDAVVMRGEALGVKNGVLAIKRALKPGGVLDGIGRRIETGTYALTCIRPGGSYVVHSYYDSAGGYLGTYVSANTPAEVGRRIYYVDLLVDLAAPAEGEPRLLDLDELEKHRRIFPERYKKAEALLPASPPKCTAEGLDVTPL